MAELGFRTLDEMIGHVEVLDVREGHPNHWKQSGLDFSELLHRPDVPHAIYNDGIPEPGRGTGRGARPGSCSELAAPALERGERVEIEMPIRNTDRTAGTILGSEVSLKYGEEGLPDDTITLRFKGSAGQSLGAFCTKGTTFEVEGDTNDYCGQGALPAASIIVKVPEGSTFEPAENIITGNVVLYGATSGEAYFQGVAGERFCVRNSGANAVVGGRGRPRLRIHDRWPGRDPGRDGSQLRRGHERRHRLRTRRGRPLRQPRESGRPSISTRSTTRTSS